MIGKKKRKAIQRLKRIKKMKKGNNVPFVLANSPIKYSGFKYKYSYQSNMHNLVYKDATFYNVKFQNSIITECNFRCAKLVGVDFCHSNLKGCHFQRTHLKDVLFVNCNLKNTEWKGAAFENVYFISTNVSVCKDFIASDSTYIFNSYPANDKLRKGHDVLIELAAFNAFYKYHVLHVSNKKPNYWIVKILYDRYDTDLWRALHALSKRKTKSGFYTLYSYKKFIDNYLNQ